MGRKLSSRVALLTALALFAGTAVAVALATSDEDSGTGSTPAVLPLDRADVRPRLPGLGAPARPPALKVRDGRPAATPAPARGNRTTPTATRGPSPDIPTRRAAATPAPTIDFDSGGGSGG